jgi:thiol-disulfide isomerase/thioredoxin
MKIKHIQILSLLLFFTFTLVNLSGCTENDPGNGINFSFMDRQGNTREFSEFYGKVIILDLMGVNCQPCFYQLFELEKISENYTNDVNILSVDVWVQYGENIQLVNQYIDEITSQSNLDLEWTFGLDDADGTIFNKYVGSGVPTLYVIKPNGNIYYSFSGYTDYQTIKTKIDEIIR